MKDIYLNSTSKEALVADLANVNAAFVNDDGELVQASHSFAIDYIGVLARPGTGKWDEEGNELEPVEFYPGVHCNVRLLGDLENAFDGVTSAETTVLDPKTPCRVFA